VPSAFRRAIDIVLATSFLIVICLPALGTLLPAGLVEPLTEKRAPVARPPLAFDSSAFRAFHHGFEYYWNDAFGFRPALVRGYNALAVALGVSPSDQVVIGTAGWWFVGDHYRAVEYQRATRAFTSDELEQWRRRLEARRDWLAERGIAYLFMIAPDKASVYPQYFPRALNRVGPETRLDQLVRHLEEHSEVRIVDVRDALADAKHHGPVYEPLDSHWNDLGAWVAYAAIAERLHVRFPQIATVPLGHFERRYVTGQGNDLALLLSLGSLFPGNRLTLVPHQTRRARWLTTDAALPTGSLGVVISVVDDPALPRAVMLHDSFGDALRPFLSEHFSRVFYSWQALFDPALIDREQPAVVLQEIVERALMEDFPDDPEKVTRAKSRRSSDGAVP
jgi:hypothetical protein